MTLNTLCSSLILWDPIKLSALPYTFVMAKGNSVFRAMFLLDWMTIHTLSSILHLGDNKMTLFVPGHNQKTLHNVYSSQYFLDCLRPL